MDSKETAKEARHFLELELEDWAMWLKQLGQPTFRAGQIYSWIYEKSVRNPTDMSNLPKALRTKMDSDFLWNLPTVLQKADSQDGTSKLLIGTGTKHSSEAVIMRYNGRTTLCVSSQVGCRLACTFCQTGRLGLVRHLRAHEIIGQLYLANEILAKEDEERRVTNVVFMGMGEPFDNFEATIKAANRMMAPDAFGLSRRHVTLSTSGIVPRIRELPARCRASLALSLHAANDKLRTDLMPINRRYRLADLKDALLDFQKTTGDKITIEYILIANRNMDEVHAKELLHFLRGIKAKINLIPFNAHPGLPFARPEESEIMRFQRYFTSRSIPATVRYSRGLEVSAACGQLAAKRDGELHSRPSRKNLLDDFQQHSSANP